MHLVRVDARRTRRGSGGAGTGPGSWVEVMSGIDDAVRRVGAGVVDGTGRAAPRIRPGRVDTRPRRRGAARAPGSPLTKCSQAVLGPLDGPPEPHRRVRDQDLLGIEEHDLRAEAAADVRARSTSTLNSGRPKIRARPFLIGSGAWVEFHTRELPGRARRARPRRRAPRSGCRSSARCRAARGRTWAAPANAASGSPTRWTTRAARLPGHVGVDERPPGPRGRLEVGDHRQRLVRDVDQPDGVLGHVAVVGDHERDELARRSGPRRRRAAAGSAGG